MSSQASNGDKYEKVQLCLGFRDQTRVACLELSIDWRYVVSKMHEAPLETERLEQTTVPAVDEPAPPVEVTDGAGR